MCYFFYIFVTMLELKIKSCRKDCESLIIKDITGFYDETLNETGWGTPNILKSSLINATLTINNSDGSVVQENILEVIQNSVYSTYDLFTIENIKDGVYTITLEIETENDTYSVSITHAVYCHVECCVNKLAVDASKDNCVPCSSEKTDKYILAYTLLSALKSKCLSNTEFLKILSRLQKICTTGDCGCGC